MRYRRTIAVALGVLGAASVYETLVALRVIAPGSLPGDAPPGHTIAGLAAGLGIVAAALLTAALASLHPKRELLPVFLAPGAAAFLVSYFYTFDPYYLPSLIRYADRDFVSPALVATLAGLSGAVGTLAWLKPRLGLSLSSPLIVACGLTAWWSGVGH